MLRKILDKHLAEIRKHILFLVGKSWNRKITAKRIRFLYIISFLVLSFIEALGLIIRALDAQISHICTSNAGMLNLTPIHFQYLSKKDVLSISYIESKIYHHSL